MKHAWLVALALTLLLAAPAEARKRCRSVEPPAEETVAEAESRWPHDVGSGWVHENASSRWVHEGDAAEEAVDAGWVHDTDYGWWAAVPDVALAGPDPDPVEAPEEDCTVSKERNECVVLGNQVATYTFRLGLAREREDEDWEESLEQTIDGLEARAALYQCPWLEPSLREKILVTLDKVMEAAGVAARVAAMMYRMGLF